VTTTARARHQRPNGARPRAGHRSVRPAVPVAGRGAGRTRPSTATGRSLVVTLLRAGVSPTLLVDLLAPAGPDSPAILAAERPGKGAVKGAGNGAGKSAVNRAGNGAGNGTARGRGGGRPIIGGYERRVSR
jgi:hypothetical protein